MEELWVRSPAWVLKGVAADADASSSAAPAASLQLLVSGGVDETYWVDELQSDEGAKRVLAAWQANSLHALRDDPECGAAVRQLRRLGALLPQAALQSVQHFSLHWWGAPDAAWQAELDRQLGTSAGAHAAPTLRRVGAEASEADAIRVYVRTTASWIESLRPYCEAHSPHVHVLIDLAYHHSLVLGPWVVPGQTACLACMGLRTVRRWGDGAVAEQPLASAHPALSVAMLLQLLREAASVAGQAAWVEHSVQLDLRTLQTQRVRVYRQPWCPACSNLPAQEGGAEAAQGRLALS